ncbi:MAG: GGDEF domain-containing protein [Psychrobium sp.]|nr:GGDEF domain-containing protein [Psychrobium sp.]
MQRLNLHIDGVSGFDFTPRVTDISEEINKPIRRAIDKLVFLEKLNTTIELQPLLAIYAGELNLRLPLTGIEFELDEQQFQLKYSKSSRFTISNQLIFGSGALGTMRYLSSRPFTDSQRQIIASLQEQLKQPLQNVLTFEHSKKLSLRDFLTGLGNRSYFDETLSYMSATAQRENRAFSLVILDLDNFKQVNDKYGHHEGDIVLKQFAKILINALRTNDHVFRFGGDEFVLLLAHSESLNPSLVSQRIIDNTRSDDILSKLKVTTSVGFSNWRQGDTNTSLLERADKALYAAKNNGRDTYSNAD